MARIHVTTNAGARSLQAGVLVVLAAVLAGMALLSGDHPERLAGRSHLISTGSITP
jgi:hypothetical protein